MEPTFDLPDSTDWISTTLPAFEPLEAALRCEMCKEFYSNPVITSCSHTFCSICIRRSIAADGKCPSCRTELSSNKLLPNIAVREVVTRFQEARPKALELARADQEEANGTSTTSSKKRRLDDTDIEDGEDVRQTRSRQTRCSRRNAGSNDAPVEIPDSGDDGDADFLPEGMAKCPICNEAMKQELVFNHLDVCTGQGASQGRSTRSKTKNPFPTTLQRRQKDPSPPPVRQSQLNYAMMKEGALRKKLQEIGIPSWGGKDLMKRRHIEWLNIYNSNCDADDRARRSKRQLVKELEEWENTQGGRAREGESKVMRKDFDGSGYAKANKSEFDELIERARRKKATPKAEGEGIANGDKGEVQGTEADALKEPETSAEMPGATAKPAESPWHVDTLQNGASGTSIYGSDAAPHEQPIVPNHVPEAANATNAHTQPDEVPLGLQNPLGSTERKLPMFTLPEDLIRDVDMGAR